MNSQISSRLTIPTSSCTMQVLSYPWELQYGEFYTINLLPFCCLGCCQGPGTTFYIQSCINFSVVKERPCVSMNLHEEFNYAAMGHAL